MSRKIFILHGLFLSETAYECDSAQVELVTGANRKRTIYLTSYRPHSFLPSAAVPLISTREGNVIATSALVVDVFPTDGRH